MIIALKGSPQYAIDNDGIMTITTTWMLMPDSGEDGKSATHWLEFETEVESWAGSIGDNYKKPKKSSGTEVSEFTEVDAFKVASISYACAEGRAYYEVTFTNEQNIKTMQMAGNVSAEINENNEKTKTIRYYINVAGTDTNDIDANFIESGTTVAWAGTDYLVSSSSYNAVSKTRYELTISAQDMSIMMIGNPQKSTDAFGQHTMSATWRYSVSAYNDWTQPEEGSDASTYLGLESGSGYLVTDVSIEPNGVLGYTITINAKHVSKRFIKASKHETRKPSGVGYYTKHDIQYQSDGDGLAAFESLVGTQASDILDDAVGSITEVSVEESGRNDYNIQISTTDEPDARGESAQDMQDDIGVSVAQASMTLDPEQLGWFKGLSGEFYPINLPPTTKFSYTLSPESLRDMRTARGGTLNDSDILDAIKGKATIGYDRVVGVQAFRGDTLLWLSDSERKNLSSLTGVQSIKLEGFVYAQPTMTDSSTSLRYVLFEEWKSAEKCPITVESTGDTQVQGRDKAFYRKLLKYQIQMMQIDVSMYYKGNSAKILSKDFDDYYKKAIKYIKSDAFTSYKGCGISLSETRDEDGDVWTQVSCQIHALLATNPYGMKWNPSYDSSYVSNGD